MIDIIVGNICSFFACLCDSISGTRKTKKSILITQIFSQIFYIVSSLALKAYSATVQNVVTIFRNLYGASDKHNKIMEWIFTICQVVFGIYFNNQGLLGLIPVIANLQYTLVVFAFKNNPRGIKISFIISVLLFMFFNFFIMNYVGCISCMIIVITTVISVYKESNIEKDLIKM